MEQLGRVWYPNDKTKRPRLKRYLAEMACNVLTNVWTDIDPINSQAKERLGYPTQSPEHCPNGSSPPAATKAA